jgi:anti-sigma factor RsiW
MSDHVIELLGAYLDGELHNGQLRKVVAHLDECQFCQEEYAALQALSLTLQEAPLPDFPSPERFAADVALRLPRKPVKPIREKALELGWWLAPVGLIATWIFISTIFLVSDLVTAANGFGLLSTASDWLVSGSSGGAQTSAFLGQFGFLEMETLEWFTRSESITRNLITNMFWQVAIAMFYLSWLAIWWARRTRQGLGEALRS